MNIVHIYDDKMQIPLNKVKYNNFYNILSILNNIHILYLYTIF